MRTAPDWLTWVSPAIALLALCISTATYRRAGPRVRVRASLADNWSFDDTDLQLTFLVRNTGLAPIQIVGLRLAIHAFGSAANEIPTLNLAQADRYDGPETPFTLAGGHQVVWTHDVRAAATRQFDAKMRLTTRPASPLAPYMAGIAAVGRSIYKPWRFTSMGIVGVVDLGNGVQVSTRPLYRFSYLLYREAHKGRFRISPEERARVLGDPGGSTID